ncbi:MAG: hypothetical protein LBV43_08050 [Prevotella sp.]|jgi:hypothetical protein|nr:hypothetical protein [Prevotella sp.]
MFTHIRLLLLILLCVLLSGCYTWDDDACICCSGTKVTVLNIILDVSMIPYSPVSGKAAVDEVENPDVRAIIGIYSKAGNLVERKVFNVGKAGSIVYSVNDTIQLPAAEYRLVFWADYVLPGSVEDLYYDTENLAYIQTIGDYRGNTELKDAFTTYLDVNLEVGNGSVIPENIILHRPFSKYQIIATDLREYLSVGGVSDVADIRCRISYPGLVYDSYDAVQGKPADVWNGGSFSGQTHILSLDELLLGWDYIWATDEASMLKANVRIYDTKGHVINQIDQVEIPYMRNRLTTVKGAFLTEESDSGIGVVTDYEGNIDIPLP